MADEQFEVEKIPGKRRASSDVTEYEIRWWDYGPRDDSWEPQSSLALEGDVIEPQKVTNF